MENRTGKKCNERKNNRNNRRSKRLNDSTKKSSDTKRTNYEFPKIIAGAFAAIGVCAFLFGGLSDAVMAAELGKTAAVPTSYLLKEEISEAKPTISEDVTVSTETLETPAIKELQEKKADNYVKGNYKVVSDPLTKDSTPTEKDLTQDAAAEIGARMLWELFGLKMKGATIYMSYNSGTETFPRAFWSGDVRLGNTRLPEDTCYTFIIDAVTGERFNAGYARTLEKEVSLDFDKKLMDNPGEYTELARKLAEELDIVDGKAASSEYGCQGYSNNDPDITIEVTGTNGDRALLSFSRYDQQFKGIIYDASLKISEPAEKASAMKASEKAQETLEALPEVEYAESENPYLIPSVEAE